MTRERSWNAVSRWHEYDAERRANLVRLCGITAFYAVELAVYHGPAIGLPSLSGVDLAYHAAITAACIAWASVAVAVLLLLRARRFPRAMPYVTSALDVVLLTAVLCVTAGPRSAVVLAYFPIIALTGLRTSVSLTRFATVAAVLGYVFLLGNARWFRPDLTVPRHEQALTLVALILTGVIIGQCARRARHLASDFADRVVFDAAQLEDATAESSVPERATPRNDGAEA